jgi:hypothetical protein
VRQPTEELEQAVGHHNVNKKQEVEVQRINRNEQHNGDNSDMNQIFRKSNRAHDDVRCEVSKYLSIV